MDKQDAKVRQYQTHIDAGRHLDYILFYMIIIPIRIVYTKLGLTEFFGGKSFIICAILMLKSRSYSLKYSVEIYICKMISKQKVN